MRKQERAKRKEEIGKSKEQEGEKMGRQEGRHFSESPIF
jgi:hypothetical protein